MDAATQVWSFFARCTLEARRVVFYARQAVGEIGGQAISAEHILCGLLRADVAASRHLVALPMSAGELRARMKGLEVGEPASDAVDVPLTGEARRIFDRAWVEAESLGQRKVRSDHLLLGLLGGESAAASLLAANGLKADAIRRSIPERDPDDDES